MEVFDGAEYFSHPPEALSELVQRLTEEFHDFESIRDRRSGTRLRRAIPVLVQPISKNFRPLASCFQALTRDISTRGIGLISIKSIQYQFVAIRLTMNGKQIDVAAEVLRCEQLGIYYVVGCQFITKLNV